MPNKHQAQAKMASQTQPAHVSRSEATVIALRKDGLISDSVAQRTNGRLKYRDVAIVDTDVEAKSTSVSSRLPAGRVYGVAKRFFDISLGSFLLVIASPIIMVAAIAIRINTPGSPFFFQTRLGKHGKPFRIFKLRGMYIDARIRFPEFYDYSKQQDLEFCFHHEEDPRVTRAGRFIRKSSIDELPNLWNVVTGDMSLVGPRPEIPEVLELYGAYRQEYLSVKPGVTCLSKCTGRDTLTKRETIEFDIGYIRNRSFWTDIKILWRTFRSVIFRRDVF